MCLPVVADLGTIMNAADAECCTELLVPVLLGCLATFLYRDVMS